jgi:transcriptional regulator with XRE-family HTH domain
LLVPNHQWTDIVPKKSVRSIKAPPQKAEVHVGDIVRHLRKTRHLSVRTLADKCGFSPSFISQIELRQASPSIASTERIASALGVTLGEFFRAVDPPLPAIIRSHARSMVQSEWSRAKIEALGPFNQDSQLEPMVITIQPGGKSGHKPYVRRAEQLAVVLQGTVELTLEDEVHDLKRGDAAGIPAGSPHCWRNKSQRAAQILIVTAHRAL